MRNNEAYERYREQSRLANVGHALKALALYGRHEMLEGAAIDGAVILEFPSMAGARAYHHGAAYLGAVQHRFLDGLVHLSGLERGTPCDPHPRRFAS
jgi:uncharacterized protein (DUF1330 family)